MTSIIIGNKWPRINMHTIVYLSWIRGRQVYVITLQCKLCDDIHPRSSSQALGISIQCLLWIIFLSKACHLYVNKYSRYGESQ